MRHHQLLSHTEHLEGTGCIRKAVVAVSIEALSERVSGCLGHAEATCGQTANGGGNAKGA